MWKERVLYVHDSGWGLCVPWVDSPLPSSLSHDLKISFTGAGLFDQVYDLLGLLFDGILLSLQ
ncbi:UNVERIFIED_CONTAM: hypothetical protein Sindi_1254600, partial [Sesamum indicum]